MALRVYNTLTRRKEEFAPVTPGKVGIYSCGPTVYDYFHIGNARAFVVPDVIRRYLKYRGYEVTLVQNITDIEDKIIARAAERKAAPRDIVDEYTRAFFEDRGKLGIGAPDIQPRATEHVGDIIHTIETLIEKGLAYVRGGDVYYDVSRFPQYGALSHQNTDDLVAGARVDVGDVKDDPLDFALWKAAKPGEPSWDSPWGPGRPGWHIECSVMSSKYLGRTFDIHTGGIDLVFPHHENEIAQSQGVSGVPPVKYWVHNGYVNIDGKKMSKSLGNFKTVRDIMEQYPGRVVRYFLICNHYRKPINFSDVELAMCEKALGRLEDAIRNSAAAAALDLGDMDGVRRAASRGAEARVGRLDTAAAEAVTKFEMHMDDDFNTAGAIAGLHDLATAMNGYVNGEMPSPPDDAARGQVARAVLTMLELASVVGIIDPDTVRPAAIGAGSVGAAGPARVVGSVGVAHVRATARAEGDIDAGADGPKLLGMVDDLIMLLLDVRTQARAAKQYGISDLVRDRLGEMGVVVEDTREGARWKFAAK